MGKFKKYWLYKYPYKVTVKNNELPNDIIGKNFIIEEDYITFLTNKKGLLKVNNMECNIENNKIKNIKNLLSRRLIGIFSLLIILFLMIFSNYYIRSISFENNIYYNQEVYEYVENNLDKVGNIYLLKKDINSLSIDLRNKFNYYAFVGLTKKGGTLFIKIVPNEKIIKHEKINNNGLFARKNCLVTNIQIKNGSSLISLNQMVKKGDLLVEGENSEAIIIGRTIDIEEISIKKVSSKNQFTGNSYHERYFKVFNYNNLNKNINFDLYTESNELILDLFILKIYEKKYFEIKEIKDEVNIELLKHDIKTFYEGIFYKNIRTNEEKVVDVQILDITEDNEKYFLKLLTVKYENIV